MELLHTGLCKYLVVSFGVNGAACHKTTMCNVNHSSSAETVWTELFVIPQC